MPPTVEEIDQRQRALERDVAQTAAAAKLHLDALVAIERRLMHIQFAFWIFIVLLAALIFSR